MRLAITMIFHTYSQLYRIYIPFFSSLKDENCDLDIKKLSVTNWYEVTHYILINDIVKDNRFCNTLQANAKYIANLCCQHVHWCDQNHAQLVAIFDTNYPDLLRHTNNPPLILTIGGEPKILPAFSVAVVGSRRASLSSLNAAYLLGQTLAQLNLLVVSGGAYGVDIAVHKGVLSTCKQSVQAIVVLASGFLHMGPKGNCNVFKCIWHQGGAVVSERLWNAAARPYDFPIRNRIISGFSQLLIVVESTLKSGALITANFALDQGREVIVLKEGNQALSLGNQQLVDDGAKCLTIKQVIDYCQQLVI